MVLSIAKRFPLAAADPAVQDRIAGDAGRSAAKTASDENAEAAIRDLYYRLRPWLTSHCG